MCERQPRGSPAVLVTDGREVTRTVTFGELADDSSRLANALRGLGVGPGDRIGIVLPQRSETAVAHVAAAKLGAVAVPLSILFGPDALDMRLRDAEVRVVIGEGEPLERIAELGLDVPLIDVDRDLEQLLGDASPRFEPVSTTPDTPALLVYTSGTTGPPKGALHGHRVLPGHLPGFELSHDHFPHDGDVIWTPADWAWIGGLYDVLMPALRHGRPVVAHRGGRFDPERAFDLIGRIGVRNVFMPATALRLMRRHDPGTPVSLRTVASGGETVGVETADWCRDRLGVRLNEFYGQTEANLLVGNCSAWEARPGSMGLPYPGHEVRVVVAADEVDVAVLVLLRLVAGVQPAVADLRRCRLLVPPVAEERDRVAVDPRADLAVDDAHLVTGIREPHRAGARLPGGAGRGRLRLLRRPRRRRHLERGPSHRTGPDRGVPDPSSRRLARSRDRLAGRGAG